MTIRFTEDETESYRQLLKFYWDSHEDLTAVEVQMPGGGTLQIPNRGLSPESLAEYNRRHEAMEKVINDKYGELGFETLSERHELIREAAMDNAGSYENQNHIFSDDRG
jgi:hypothetical protein